MAHSLFFIAGDPSGDQHAARIIERLRAIIDNLECYGVGGPCMENAGFRPIVPFAPFNRMGLAEVILHLPFFLSARRRLGAEMRRRRPSALVCVDYPGFNIPMMKDAWRMGIPVVWYIVPQVWAWKPKRAAILARYARFIGVIFPFELRCFEGRSAVVRFTGHPLVEAMDTKKQNACEARIGESLRRHRDRTLRIAIVPGSRRQEVLRMLGPMVDAFRRLHEIYPGLSATVSAVRAVEREAYRKALRGREIELHDGELDEMLAQADLAFVTSGTATLQTALWQIPMVIAYRTSEITYAVVRPMVKLPYIGLPNIIAGERVVPECIQHQAEGKTLANRMRIFIESEEHYIGTQKRLARLREKLGEKKPSEEMAMAIREVIVTSTINP